MHIHLVGDLSLFACFFLTKRLRSELEKSASCSAGSEPGESWLMLIGYFCWVVNMEKLINATLCVAQTGNHRCGKAGAPARVSSAGRYRQVAMGKDTVVISCLNTVDKMFAA